jgi:hypothetical protein
MGCDLLKPSFWPPAGVHLFGLLTFFLDFPLSSMKKGGCTYWNLLSSGWGCGTYLYTAHPKGPLHLFGGFIFFIFIICFKGQDHGNAIPSSSSWSCAFSRLCKTAKACIAHLHTLPRWCPTPPPHFFYSSMYADIKEESCKSKKNCVQMSVFLHIKHFKTNLICFEYAPGKIQKRSQILNKVYTPGGTPHFCTTSHKAWEKLGGVRRPGSGGTALFLHWGGHWTRGGGGYKPHLFNDYFSLVKLPFLPKVPQFRNALLV